MLKYQESKSFNPGTTVFSTKDDFLTLLRLYLKYNMKTRKKEKLNKILNKTFNDQKKDCKSKSPEQKEEDTLEVIHGQGIQSVAKTSLS